MRTALLSRALLAVLALPLLGALFGCSEDESSPTDPCPCESKWSAVELPPEASEGILSGIALRTNSSAAVGIDRMGNGLLLENTSRGWVVATSPDLTSVSLGDVVIDGMGRRALVGASGTTVQWALTEHENETWSEAIADPTGVGLYAVDVDDAGLFLAVGMGFQQFAAWRGRAEEVWTAVDIPAPGDPQEKALVDVSYGGGVWAACGFDDGGEGTVEQPYSMLMVDTGSGWDLVEAPCGGCGNQEYRAIAVNGAGAVFLGGAVTDFSMGAEDPYVAFLRLYSPSTGDWTEIVLPDPGSLDRVNEILLAPGGDIYLACGLPERSSLVRLPAGASSADPENVEWSAEDVVLHGLASSGAGTVYAVGASLSTGSPRSLMLSRDPPSEE